MTNVEGILHEVSSGIVVVGNRRVNPTARHEIAKVIGRKGAGLSLLPSPWTPPFFALSAQTFAHWRDLSKNDAEAFLVSVADRIAVHARDWASEWNRGICLRSSATEETLNERGTYNSLELTADFDAAKIARSVAQIYHDFVSRGGSGNMAIVVQARAAVIAMGHISNELRVSKTVNHWSVEYERPDALPARFNSQRDRPPDSSRRLGSDQVGIAELPRLFGKVGRWCSGLGLGRGHLEWGLAEGSLWIFQFDLEADQPDAGVNPNDLMRSGDFSPVGALPVNSPLKIADLSTKVGWKKIDKVSILRDPTQRPYPTLIYITGDDFRSVRKTGYDLAGDLEKFAGGRIVCRTDCNSENVRSLNLPRTDTVSSVQAVEFMDETLTALAADGVQPTEVCFILHKFIPAIIAAWAVARPNDNVVRVDALWGLPDGLQYLPHDSFEYDIARSKQSTERIRYKSAFLQEAASGAWEVSRVSRKFARTRCLPAADLAYIAQHTHAIAKNTDSDIQVMWFGRVPEDTSLPANIPWFSMPPHASAKREGQLSPTKKRFVVRAVADLDEAAKLPRGQVMLQIDPDDPELFRSNEFLDRIKDVALANEFPVGLTGSILGHAFYVLEKSGLAVVAFNEPTRARVRDRQVFHKIVRDDIPKRISESGETVTLAEISPEEARAALVGKIFEESFELLAADAPADVTAELADMLEVVRSLANSTGVAWDDVVSVADDKRAKRGSFERNLVLLETASPGWVTKQQKDIPGNIRIPLKELNSITTVDGAVTVPFSHMLGNGLGATIQLSDGSYVKVTLGPQGFSVSLTGADKGNGQMNLFDPPSR